MRKLTGALSLLSALLLAACGGGASLGDGGGGGLGGDGSGGGNATGIVAAVTLVAQAEQVVADNTSTVLLTATLTDTTDNPIAGKELKFITNAGSLSSDTVTTDKNGQARVYLKSSSELGTATVLVAEAKTGVSASTNIQFVAASATNVSLSVAPTQLAPGSEASVNVQVVDVSGNPVSGIIVTLSAPTNNSGGVLQETFVTTDPYGRASTKYTAGAAVATSTVIDTLKAALAGGQSAIQSVTVSAAQSQIAGITLTIPGADDGRAQVSPVPFDAATAIKTAVVVTVRDGANNAVSGQAVTFSTTAGKLQSGAGMPAITVTAITDSNGRASVMQLSPTQSGNAVITASTGGYSSSSTLEFVARPPAKVLLSVAPTSLIASQQADVSAFVLDANGNFIPDIAVTFSAASGNSIGGGSFSKVTVSTSSVVDANAMATTTYIAPTNGATSDTITARIANGLTSNAVPVIISQNTSNITAVAVDPAVSTVPVNGTVVLRASVTVSSGSAAGITVHFSSSLGTLSSSTATTDSAGVASVTLTAPSRPGTAQITATAGAYGGQNTVEVLSGGANSLSISLSPDTVAPGSQTTVTATVRDANNNLVSGVTVDFAVQPNNSQGALGATSAITGQNGIATTTYTAGATTSNVVDTITASIANSGLSPASAGLQVSVTSVPVKSVSLIASSPQLLSNATAAASGVTLTAVVKDQNNNVVPGIKVTFASRVDTGSCGTGGALQLVDSGNTNATGQATAILTTGGDTTNQEINVTAAAAGVSSSTKITETGTTIAINGPDSVGLGAKQSFTVSFKDAGNKPIASRVLVVTSANGNTIAPHAGSNCSGGACTTDGSGQFTIDYTGVTDGKDTLTVTPQACGNDATSAQQAVQVAAQTLTIVAPADNAEIPFGTNFSAGAEIAGGGTGYIVGDTLTLSGGTSTTPAQLVVTSVSGTGAIIGFTVRNAGDYTVLPTSPATATGGSGTGATFTVWQNITVRLAGGTINGQTITFNATRGTLSATTAVTNASGIAAVRINQTSAAGSAGGAIVTATCTSCSPTISTSTSLQFDATTPARVDLQASPSIVSVNGTSVISAVVRDANDNLVANQRVNFTLVDNSGGGLQQSTAVTNSGGKATITYRAGPTTGSKDGVQITGTTVVGGVSGTTVLTVGGQALRIVLGTGNKISPLNATQYQLPYSVLVTDSAGNPPPAGSIVNLQVNAVAYRKGYLKWNGTIWSMSAPGKQRPICPGDSGCDSTDWGCANEDTIPPLNGILDSGEDYNHNGRLDPGNVTSVPISVALDANGTGEFDITYPKDRAGWTKVMLDATILVNGDQGRTSVQFVLPWVSADLTNETVSPPGEHSPNGEGDTCADPN
jgi:hypothetical protein